MDSVFGLTEGRVGTRGTGGIGLKRIVLCERKVCFSLHNDCMLLKDTCIHFIFDFDMKT